MRPQDWPERLAGYLGEARRTPFAWGTHDCVSFVCGWHKLMTGADVFAPFRGTYNTDQGASDVMRAHGVEGMEQAGVYLFGAPVPPHRIGRGDIVYAEGALGICNGSHGAFLNEEKLEFSLLRRERFMHGWSV